MHDLTFLELSKWDQITPAGLSEKDQKEFQSRQNALRAVAAGTTISLSAKRFNVNARTLDSTIRKALSNAPDGRPWGWRACVPYRVRLSRQTARDDFPLVAGPGAFSAFLRKAPDFQEMLTAYAGPLPTRNAPSPRFDRFFEKLRGKIRDLVPPNRYPANDATFARRSILEFLRTQRRGYPFIDEEFQTQDAVDANQLTEVFALQLADWVQYDGHSVDCHFFVEGENPDGVPYLQRITKTWLLVGYFALLRLCNSWKLSFSVNYSGTDFNETCANSLREWTPRDLLAPTMTYIPGSGIGTHHAIGFVATGVITSLDNAMAHKLDVNRQRLAHELHGVIHFGRSGVPETRGYLEAWNKRIEEAAIRDLPGGYRPPGANSDTPTKTSPHAPEHYPVVVDALEDLMDVTISAANVSSIDAFQSRSPTQSLQSFAASGGWIFSTRDHDRRACSLSKLVCVIRISGSKKKKRQPYVRFRYAKYRSISLKNRWDLVGKHFQGQIDIHDGRFLRLYDENGELFVVLRAIQPWGRSIHSLALRKLISRLARQGRCEIRGVKDAIPIFRAYLRGRLHMDQEAATMAAQFRENGKVPNADSAGVAVSAPPTYPSKPRADVYVPLTGRVNLGRKEGPQ